MNFPFENKFGGTGQQNVVKISVALLETDIELIAPLHLYLNWRSKSVDTRRDQSGCGNTRAAGQGFAFDTSFKGTDANSIRAKQLDEIHVCALGPEVRVPADFGAELLDHGPVCIGHKEHCVRHPRVQRMNGLCADGK